MSMLLLLLLSALAVSVVDCSEGADNSTGLQQRGVALLLEHFNTEEEYFCRLKENAYWNNTINRNQQTYEQVMRTKAEEMEMYRRRKAMIDSVDWQSELASPDLRRQLRLFDTGSRSVLYTDRLKQLDALLSAMIKFYLRADICLDNGECNLVLHPDLDRLMHLSRDEHLRREVWLKWRDASGKKLRHKYNESLQLIKEIAKLDGFANAKEMWLSHFESPSFEEQVGQIWEQVRPLYEHLHAYTRHKLGQFYPTAEIEPDGPIPAHLVGGMWSSQWLDMADLLLPYPKAGVIDITYALREQGYTAVKMYRLVEHYLVSLGLAPLPATFWNNSVLQEPEQLINCFPSAWGFCSGNDSRVIHCARVTMDELATALSLVSQLQYERQYWRQPAIFRSPANPAMKLTITETLSLSMMSPMYLKQIGLLENTTNSPQSDLNYLMRLALEKVPMLPFILLIDRWRWGVFDGSIGPQQWNCAWWRMRRDMQGVKPPITRTEHDFDPGAKYHVPENARCIKFFVAHVLHFQFHKALCIAAGRYHANDTSRQLHQCHISDSREAGQRLAEMMKLGRSVPWPEAIEVVTGQRQIDASAMLEYFAPLLKWLQQENARNNVTIGWHKDDIMCSSESGSAGNSIQLSRSAMAAVTAVATIMTSFHLTLSH